VLLVNLLKIVSDAIVMVLAAEAAGYGLILRQRFFKRGIFQNSITLTAVGFAIFAIAEALDLTAGLIESDAFELSYTVLEGMSMVVLFFAMFHLHKAWSKLGRP